MLSKDLLNAFRMLRNNPVFALTTILTLALGIGASTAIFSVTNSVLLRPLPYKDPDRLVLACNDLVRRNVKDFPISNADFLDLRNGAKNTFEDFGAVTTGRGPVPQADGTPEQVRFASVSTNFFRLMGAPVVLGRDFEETDGVPQSAPPQPQSAPQAARCGRRPTLHPGFPSTPCSATDTSSAASAPTRRQLARLCR